MIPASLIARALSRLLSHDDAARKLLAAHRGGITTVLIPEDNRKDLAEIPKNILAKIEVRPVQWIDQILAQALVHLPEPSKPDAELSVNQETPARSPAASEPVRPH